MSEKLIKLFGLNLTDLALYFWNYATLIKTC